MYLVHPKKNNPGKWEVAWEWVPHFLAADLSLVSRVDQVMSSEFQGLEIPSDDSPEMELILGEMHNRVVHLIAEKYPMQGLYQYVQGIRTVNPEARS